MQSVSSKSQSSGASEQDLQQLRDELVAAQRRADNAELMLLTTSDVLRRSHPAPPAPLLPPQSCCSEGRSQHTQLTAVDRTSRLLDKLQQVEAMGEGARQQMRQENVSLAAREDELLEQVHMDTPPPFLFPLLSSVFC